MADLGIARPQDLLISAVGHADPALTVPHATKRQGGDRDPRQKIETQNRVEAPHESAVNLDDLKEQLKLLNAKVKDYKLHFEINDASGQIIVQVIDEETGDVLRTIPPSAVLDLHEHIGNERGFLVDSQT